MRRLSLAFLTVAALAACPAPAVAQTRIVAMQNGSGTVTTGGSSQQVFAQNDGRNYLFCQNPITATETLFVNFGSPASVGTTSAGSSVELAPGGSLSFLSAATPIQSINVTAATTGHRFVCKQGGNN